MNMCLLSMLLLTIGSAFLAGLAVYFKRQEEVDALNDRIRKMKTTLEKLDVEHRNSIAYYEGMREEITAYATERSDVERTIKDLEGQIEALQNKKDAPDNPDSESEKEEEPVKLLPHPDVENGDGVEYAQGSARKTKKNKKRKSSNKDKDKQKPDVALVELGTYKSKVAELESKMEELRLQLESAAANKTIEEDSKVEEKPTVVNKIVEQTPKDTKQVIEKKIITPKRSISGEPKVNGKQRTVRSKKVTSKNSANDPKSILARINRKRNEVDFEKIGFSAVGRKDDLQKIAGIEPFIERKLNALGIYRFSQIANFNDEIATKISQLIEMEEDKKDLLTWSEIAKELV